MDDALRPGVWQHPAGPRIEVTRQVDGWHVAAYSHRAGGRPGADAVFVDSSQAAERIRNLEAQGYAHQPGQTPNGPTDPPSQWTPGNVLGALLLFVVILAVGMWLLG
ncbi:hypothetical protein [Verrucosispora sp. WMMD1129]|uniref:hypothetical protein n=1 Tax=Verrucosispora sp. WMMD1129 TaxID=3016093 RepID=UPI002499FE8D|nr:hypothetical protein [Verrucosispora sp. WMMD1129]WFE45305.1 hypothetical protein O7624_13570 [Verrucosispora sp. WMMD1129]